MTIPTLTKKGLESIFEDILCPLSGYGEPKNIVDSIQKVRVKGKTTRIRYVMTLKGGAKIHTMKDWNDYHKGGPASFSRVMLDSLGGDGS